MAATLTPSAAEAVQRTLAQQGLDASTGYLRVAVKGGGCAGMSYQLQIEREPGPKDLQQASEGIRILIDRKSYLFVNGTRIDFGGSRLLKGFLYENPNVQDSCGCGHSFSVDADKLASAV